MKQELTVGFRRMCAWCGTALDAQSTTLASDAPITHGICSSCKAGLLGERSHSFGDFLERLDGPVVLLGPDTVVQEANSRACALLGMNRLQLEQHRPGEVIDCVYSEMPGGCGASEHCLTGCVIRRSVVQTLTTGKPVVRAAAEQAVLGPEGRCVRHFVISTERAGSLVLLRVDAAE